MKKAPYFLLVFIILAFFIFFSQQSYDSLSVDEIKYVEVANQKIKVDVVDTPETRAQGLSGRESLAEDSGMLFVFEEVNNYPFWMKDMNFSIDIIWLNEHKRITYIKKNATPETYPNSFGPKEKTSRYVLEVLSGFSDKFNLQVGDKIHFLP